jgi:ribosomal protein S25
MVNKENIESPGSEKQKEENRKPDSEKKRKATVNYDLLARWVQEQVLKDVPELGYVSEHLIERILKTAHKYYIQQGYTSIKLADNR